MKITLSDAGKRFNRDWIFRHFNYHFLPSKTYAITGPNGSGKSTLLQFIAGAIMPSEGKVIYTNDQGKSIPEFFPFLSIAAPYLETIEEMTANEFLRFHQVFKPFRSGVSLSLALELVGLSAAGDKQIRYYSSGMKQRLKLAQAFFSDTPVLLLDEPTTNLDAPGISLYQDLIRSYSQDRLLIISSNDPAEYAFCETVIDMEELKGNVANVEL